MNAVAVIPARYGSTRFPGKPLARSTGKFLVQHVYERASDAARVDRVIVATDDRRVADAVTSFGGEVALTRSDHTTGTDRVAEVAGRLDLADDDVIINVQGDEPELAPAALNRLIERMEACPAGVRIGTLATRFDGRGPRDGPDSPLDPNRVKVVLDAAGCALYFSRSMIPYPRESGGRVDQPADWLLHIGVYAFRWDALRRIAAHGVGGDVDHHALARVESLEQLGWLVRGMRMAVCVVPEASVGIDTPEDYAAFVERMAARRG